jgi:phosphomethylpyrimidine synthase
MTQLEYAKKNITTDLTKKIAKEEGINPEIFRRRLKKGTVVIFNNNRRKMTRPCAVGLGLRTKINANIGTSTDCLNLNDELEKLRVSIKYGADTIMDLSIGGNLKKIRRTLLNNSCVPFGTVPIYEAAVNAQKKYDSFIKMNEKDMLNVLESQAQDGVDFFTIHAGITQKSMKILKNSRRLLNIVSRGGALLAAWMNHNKKENPLYEFFPRIVDIAYQYDIVLSLGDALRPGSIIDATDALQIEELETLGKLARYARERNVQVIIEGPGHVPINQIRKNVTLEKKLCNGAPFYVLGPLVTDISAGYDHITAAIGGAIAASEGADFLCYVTPSEHLRHPSLEDVKEGVIAAKIAAHAADLAKGIETSYRWDRDMSFARKKRNWKRQIGLSIDPEKANKFRRMSRPELSDVCTMCGKYCSIKIAERCLKAS